MNYRGDEIISILQYSKKGIRYDQTIEVKCTMCKNLRKILYKPHRASMLRNLKKDQSYVYQCKFCLASKRCLSSKGISWEEKLGKDRSDKRKKETSARVSGSGNNMFGRPSPNGSGNGWSGHYKGWFFRSLHELSFVIKVIERFNFKWASAEKKEFKVTYLDWSGQTRNYFPDFILNDKYLIEVKPKMLWKSPKVQAKAQAASFFCQTKNLKYKLCCVPLLSEKEIKKLYDDGIIQWTVKYEEKYKLKYKK